MQCTAFVGKVFKIYSLFSYQGLHHGFKANLNSVSKINRDCFGFTKLWPVIGPENSRHPLISSVAKLKPTDDLVTRVSPRLFTI